MFLSNTFRTFLSSLLLFSITPGAYAYIDPGTGSLLVQGLLAAVAGSMVTIKIYWHRILTFFGRRRDTDREDQQNTNNKEE